MKLVMGSRPARVVQVSRPVGQPKAEDFSAGVSDTPSPPVACLAQPPWNVWYRPNQWPISWVAVSPRLYGAAVPPGTDEKRMTTPSIFGDEAYDDGKVAQPSRPPPMLF